MLFSAQGIMAFLKRYFGYRLCNAIELRGTCANEYRHHPLVCSEPYATNKLLNCYYTYCFVAAFVLRMLQCPLLNTKPLERHFGEGIFSNQIMLCY